MVHRKSFAILIILALILSMTSAVTAQDGGLRPQPGGLAPDSVITIPAEKISRIGQAPKDFERVSVIVTFESGFDAKSLEAVSGGQIIHRYQKIFNGASLVMPAANVEAVASMRGVTKVYLDKLLQIDTERSPSFIGAPALWSQLGGVGSAGEGVVVGVLDTGIWPEHPSFADPDPFGKAYAPPPGGPYDCDFGNTTWNPNDAPFTCNNKLIGAYNFLDTYKAFYGLEPEEFDSARDSDGHGTHTASTAAGNAGVEADIFGVDRGIVAGVAPRAHVIMYHVCGDAGCYSSDSAAAVEQAILDGVDVLNFSISGGNSPYSDIVSLAFLEAFDNGVFVAASAGNDGPGADTTNHREPWVTTVAASTSDRHFISTVTLTADNSDVLTVSGASVTDGISTPTTVVFPPAGEEMCNNEFAPGTFSGEIVICRRGVIARVDKGYNVMMGGAGGMLLYNPALQGLSTDNHFLPAVQLENDAGALLLDFMATHTGVTATFTPGVATTVLGDMMAAFSSRGGSGQTLGVSKPDITAPGVQILAGHSPMPATSTGGPAGELFQAIGGTSMSSPHIAGSGALLKALHPDWTPSQIKSALMLTARGGVVKEDGLTPADPFDTGSGRVNLAAAGNPGLTFIETADNYWNLQAELWNANYPSLYVPVMPGMITVQRTVHSELNRSSLWRLKVSSPPDLKVTVPTVLLLGAGGDRTFPIMVDASMVPLGEVRHATLKLRYKTTELVFPITIVRGQPEITLEKSCDPAAFRRKATTDCTITAQNTSFDAAYIDLVDLLPRNLVLVPGTVVGANSLGNKSLFYQGMLAGAEAPEVTVVDGTGTTPAGYLPLSTPAFGIAPIAGVGDETIVNFNVPDFEYAGETYSRIGMVSNGYAVVGGGTGADVDFINQVLPDAAPPNNVLAPYWTDLNPEDGGALRIGILTDNVDYWLILDWEDVPEWGDGGANSFQIWIGLNGYEDISFTYGAVGDGDGGWLTVGAENAYGNSGENWYVDGTGTPVAANDEIRVVSVPGTPGETHTVTFTARGFFKGPWTNCARLTSDAFQGVNVACFSGVVVR